jgi:DNA-binding response OmpR family regulator
MNPQALRHQDAAHGHAATGGLPRRVLVVEDEFFLAVQIEEWLADGGFDVVDVVHTADEAVAVAVAERPGLVVMDIRLARDSDGITAAKEILARTGIRSLFASAHADAHTKQRGEEARPFGWLHKPFTAQAMLKAVNDAFGEQED